MNLAKFYEEMRLKGKPIKGKQFKSKVGVQSNREKNRRLKQMNRNEYKVAKDYGFTPEDVDAINKEMK